MTPALSWPPPDWPTLVVLLTAAVAFVAYHHGANATVLARALPRGGTGDPARAVHLQRLGGALLLGLLPAGVAVAVLPHGLGRYGLGPGDGAVAIAFVGAVAVLVLPVVWAASRRPEFPLHYPQIRAAVWDGRLHAANAATWAVYLLAYEFFFRGFLLFTLCDAYGAWPAVGVTTLAYVYAHLPKNAAETVGTIPMGVVFALGALWSGAIWAPFAAHLLIAVTSDVLAARPRRA